MFWYTPAVARRLLAFEAVVLLHRSAAVGAASAFAVAALAAPMGLRVVPNCVQTSHQMVALPFNSFINYN